MPAWGTTTDLSTYTPSQDKSNLAHSAVPVGPLLDARLCLQAATCRCYAVLFLS